MALSKFGNYNDIGCVLQMFQKCQRLVQQFNASSRLASGQEQMMIRNMVSAVARSLQELSTTFRIAQSAYLKSECKNDSLCNFLSLIVNLRPQEKGRWARFDVLRPGHLKYCDYRCLG